MQEFVLVPSGLPRIKVLMLCNSDTAKCPGNSDQTKCCMPVAGSKAEKDGDSALEQANAENVYDVAYDSFASPNGDVAETGEDQDIDSSKEGNYETTVSETDNGESPLGVDYGTTK